MQINYTLEPEDLWRYNKFLINKVSTYKLRFFLRLVTIPMLTLMYSLSQQMNWLICLLVTLCIACVWVPFCFWSLRRHYIRTIQEQPGVLGKHTLEINIEGVRQQTSLSQSVFKWSGFSEIIENKEQILFFVSQKTALIIPKNAFQSQDQVKQFLDTATAYWMGNPLPAVLTQKTEVWPPPPHMGTF